MYIDIRVSKENLYVLQQKLFFDNDFMKNLHSSGVLTDDQCVQLNGLCMQERTKMLFEDYLYSMSLRQLKELKNAFIRTNQYELIGYLPDVN